jgi:hypothetical protein
MSDRMPEDLPVTKCINVMVGITRSKVILILISSRDVCAEEFGAYSNFSCPTVSAWSWFSSPMLVWWVMMLGAHWFVSDPATNLVRIKQSVTSPMHTDCQCECCGKDLVPTLVSF